MFVSFYRIYRYPLRSKMLRHICIHRDRVGGKRVKEQHDGCAVPSDLKRSENLARARRVVRDLILCNLFDYFCTFTFDGAVVDRYDFKVCKSKITRFFNNYKTRYSPDFRYLLVPEFHKDGAVHFHGMISGIRVQDFEVPELIPKRYKSGVLRMVKNTRRYVRWKQYNLGFFSCSTVRHYESCAAYVSKYITKDLIELPLGQRVFMASTNLQRPELIFDMDDLHLPVDADFSNEYVSIKDSNESFGLIPDWWGEQCADLQDDYEFENMSDFEQQLVVADRLTYEQLKMGVDYG